MRFYPHIIAKVVPNKIGTLNGLQKWCEVENPKWIAIDTKNSQLMKIKEFSIIEESNTWTFYRGIPIVYIYYHAHQQEREENKPMNYKANTHSKTGRRR